MPTTSDATVATSDDGIESAGREDNEAAAILFPDVDVDVRDPDTGKMTRITVREFRFREALELQGRSKPLLDALTDIAGGCEGPVKDLDVIDQVLSEHADTWLALIARACDREVAWVGRLGASDATSVSAAMWTANRNFILGRIVGALQGREMLASLSASQKSSTDLSAPATQPAITTSASG